MRAILLLLALAPTLVGAQDDIHVSNAGIAYRATASDAGIVLQSLQPVTGQLGSASPPVDGPEAITLHPDCTAVSTTLGSGSWGHDAAGFDALFDSLTISFPSQDPPPVGGPGCRWQ